MRCVQFTGQGAIAQKPNNPCNKTLCVWPSSTLKTVNLEYHLSLSVAWVVRFLSESLQSLTAYA